MDSDLMFDKFFIGIGNLAFIIYFFIIHFKIPKFNLSNKKQLDFNKFDFEKSKIEGNESINKLREYFIDYFLSKKTIFILIIIGIIFIMILGVELAGIYCCLISMDARFRSIKSNTAIVKGVWARGSRFQRGSR